MYEQATKKSILRELDKSQLIHTAPHSPLSIYTVLFSKRERRPERKKVYVGWENGLSFFPPGLQALSYQY